MADLQNTDDAKVVEAELVDESGDGDLQKHWRDAADLLVDCFLTEDPDRFSPHTRRAYRRDLKSALDYIARPPNFWTRADVLDWKHKLKRTHAPSTAQRRLSTVRSFLDWLGHPESPTDLSYNPAANVSTKVGQQTEDDTEQERTERERRRLERDVYCPTREDMFALFAAVDDGRDELLLRTLYYTGIRSREAVRLRWSQLEPHSDGERGMLVIYGKGAKQREVPVTQELYERLQEHRPDDAGADTHIFQSREGGGMSRQNLDNILRNAVEAAGVNSDLSPHGIRHAHATHAYERGCKLHVLKENLGHASIETTMRYIHVDPEQCSGDYL